MFYLQSLFDGRSDLKQNRMIVKLITGADWMLCPAFFSLIFYSKHTRKKEEYMSYACFILTGLSAKNLLSFPRLLNFKEVQFWRRLTLRHRASLSDCVHASYNLLFHPRAISWEYLSLYKSEVVVCIFLKNESFAHADKLTNSRGPRHKFTGFIKYL